ncbi:MAG: hypothetical protein O3A00_12995 [Planctomycetota bacterium]|nr:hypothetical protein [Planctomycetota bacterium]
MPAKICTIPLSLTVATLLAGGSVAFGQSSSPFELIDPSVADSTNSATYVADQDRRAPALIRISDLEPQPATEPLPVATPQEYPPVYKYHDSGIQQCRDAGHVRIISVDDVIYTLLEQPPCDSKVGMAYAKVSRTARAGAGLFLGPLREWYHPHAVSLIARNRHTSRWFLDLLHPTGCCGTGCPVAGKYGMTYAVDPDYGDQRDGGLYAAQGYGVPVSVPIAPNVGHTYNYGWGTPSSRLTPLSHRSPQMIRQPAGR